MKLGRHLSTLNLILVLSICGLAGCELATDGGQTESLSSLGKLEQGIINGHLTTRSGHIFVQANYGDCSGTLVKNDWVLTAKHCFNATDKSNPSGVRLTMQTWDSSFTSFTVQIGTADTIITHPLKDLALVRMTTHFEMNGKKTGWGVATYKGALSTLPGNQAKCFGYGRSSTSNNNYGTLYEGISYINRTGIGSYFYLNPGYYGELPFRGDSGGGCWVNTNSGEKFVGTIVEGDGFGEPDYARVLFVGSYDDWIQSTTADDGPVLTKQL